MSDVNDPEEPDFDEASSTLNEGLRSCRAVILGYRALLSKEADTDAVDAAGAQIDSAAEVVDALASNSRSAD